MLALTKVAYFWSHELGSTTERAGSGAEPHILLAQTIISDLHVAVSGQKDVIELQITVDNREYGRQRENKVLRTGR